MVRDLIWAQLPLEFLFKGKTVFVLHLTIFVDQNVSVLALVSLHARNITRALPAWLRRH